MSLNHFINDLTLKFQFHVSSNAGTAIEQKHVLNVKLRGLSNYETNFVPK